MKSRKKIVPYRFSVYFGNPSDRKTRPRFVWDKGSSRLLEGIYIWRNPSDSQGSYHVVANFGGDFDMVSFSMHTGKVASQADIYNKARKLVDEYVRSYNVQRLDLAARVSSGDRAKYSRRKAHY